MRRYSLHDLIETVVDKELKDVYTCLPARVIRYYPAEQLVDVQPLIRLTLKDIEGSIQQPIVYRVPVVFPSSGGMLFSSPIHSDAVDGEGNGDTVMLHFTMRSISEWVELSGEEVVPKSRRVHDSSDAIAVVGLYTAKSHLTPDPKNPQWKFKNTKITIEDDDTDNSNIIIDTEGQTGLTINVNQGDITLSVPNGNVQATIGGELTANVAGNTTIVSPTITLDGNVVITGTSNLQGVVTADSNINCSATVTANTDVIGGGKSLKGHTHGGVSSGGSNTLPPN